MIFTLYFNSKHFYKVLKKCILKKNLNPYYNFNYKSRIKNGPKKPTKKTELD